MTDFTQRQPRPLIIAHRGYSAAFPDNTPQSFEKAIEAGADIIEMDVRLSADGILVCCHDPHVGGIDIATSTALALEQRGISKIETLVERFLPHISVLFDLKIENKELMEKLCALISRLGAHHKTIIGVRSLAQLAHLRQLDQETAALGFLSRIGDFPDFYKNGGTIGRLWEIDLNDDNLRICRDNNHPVFITTQKGPDFEGPGDTNPANLLKILAYGIDGVLLNDPTLLKN